MKNKTMVVNQRTQARILDWLYEEQEDDFLMGKTPTELLEIWEDEE